MRRLYALTVTLCVAVCSLGLSACSTIRSTEQQVAQSSGRAKSALDSATPRHNEYAPVVRKEGVWLGSQTVRIEAASTLPAVFSEPATFDRAVSGLAEIAERISVRAGIPVRLMPEVLATQPKSGATPQEPQRLNFSGGTLAGLLDAISARWGISWKYEGGQIVLFLYETKTYNLVASALDTTVDSSVSRSGSSGGDSGGSGGSGGGASGGGGSNSAGLTGKLAVWSLIEKSLGAMLSEKGRIAASPGTGTVTVTDTPQVHASVASFVEAQNRVLSRQVTFSVTVLGVTLSDSDAYGIDWDLVYRSTNARFAFTTLFGDMAQNSPGGFAISNTSPTSRFANTSAIIQALSEQGRVRKETAVTLTALNFQPVPVQVVRQQAYVAQVQTALVPQAGSQTTITAKTLVTGFIMTLLPQIQDNGTVLLQFGAEVSTVRDIASFSVSNFAVQLPQVDTRNFLQRVALRSGETLVLSGFEQVDDSSRRKGLGAAANPIAGGANGSTNKETLVIVVTPLVAAERVN